MSSRYRSYETAEQLAERCLDARPVDLRIQALQLAAARRGRSLDELLESVGGDIAAQFAWPSPAGFATAMRELREWIEA